MTCGCKNTPATVHVATRAGMCAVCPWFPSDAGVKQPCQLTIGGRPLQQALLDPAARCKEFRWPDAQGIVDWGLRRWFGVPEPLRWVFLFRWGRQPKPVGCGCDVGLKASRRAKWLDPWLSISPELREVVAQVMIGWRVTVSNIRQTLH